MSASPSDILTAIKNIVTALNNAAQTYLDINGLTVLTHITAPTVLKTSAGRVVNVSVTTAGSATGFIYDSKQLGITTNPLYVIPDTVATEPYQVNMPAKNGILVVPGTGQAVSVSYS
jgi:hypothetical protein